MGKINEHKSVIYQIRNIDNQKIYVGSASHFAARKGSHLFYLRRNQHINTHLQRAYNKYGENKFVFEILEYVDMIDNIEEFRKRLLEKEQYWIDKLKVCDRDKGYNINIKADSRLGIKHTEETKKRMSINSQGKNLGEKNGFYGKKHSEESKAKMSESSQGKSRGIKNVKAKLTEEQVIEIDELLKEGKTVAEISRIYDMSIDAIQAIKTGKHWSFITNRNRDNVNIKSINITNANDVIEIKKWLYKNDRCDQLVADIMKVHINVVSNIRSGNTYSNINLSNEDIRFLEENPEEYYIDKKITKKKVIEIKYLLKENILSQSKIGEIFELSQTAISKIKLGKSWSHIKLEDYLDENGNIKVII